MCYYQIDNGNLFIDGYFQYNHGYLLEANKVDYLHESIIFSMVWISILCY